MSRYLLYVMKNAIYNVFIYSFLGGKMIDGCVQCDDVVSSEIMS